MFAISNAQVCELGNSCLQRGLLAILASTLISLFPSTSVEAQVRARMIDGKIAEGRFYDLGNEYLELSRRLGTKLVLKREVLGWSSYDLEKDDLGGILLVLKSGMELGGNVRFDSGTREWVVELELGSARYNDVDVNRTIQPDGMTSDDRFTVRLGFHDRLKKAVESIRNGDALAKKDAENFIRSAGFFAMTTLTEELDKKSNPVLRRLHLEEKFRMALPAGVSDSHPGFLNALVLGDPEQQITLLREVLLENGSDLYPLLGLLLLDENQSSELRSFCIDILQRTHSVTELVKAWQISQGRAQLALAIALGENGLYIGFSTLLDALGLDEQGARTLAALKLEEYTGETFGFDPLGALEDRQVAIAKWREWWSLNKDRIEIVTLAAMENNTDNPQRRRSSDLWRKGLEARTDGRLDSAERFFEQAIEQDPSAMGPFVSQGVLLYQDRSDYAKALEYFSKALGRKPGSGDNVNERACYYHIGKIYALGFDLEKARGALTKSVQIDPNYSVAWFELGRVKYDEALLSDGDRAQRLRLLLDARNTFSRGATALARYREGLVVVDRTNLPFDSQLPFSARDHNNSIRQIRKRILAELGRFRVRMASISLMVSDYNEVLKEFELARQEGCLNDDLKFLASKARALLAAQEEGDTGSGSTPSQDSKSTP